MDDEWSSDANEAVAIELVEATEHGLRTVHRFHPKFTYPIFGEEERIFGYKGLDIAFRFSAHDLQPNVVVSYDEKFAAIADTSALHIEDAVKDFIPKLAFSPSVEFETIVRNGLSAPEFKPPGVLLHSYSRAQRQFEIWAGSLLDSRVRETINRMQIFISFFIEAGTPLSTTDADWTLDRWHIYFVYEKIQTSRDRSPSAYSFVGYATTYRFYTFRPHYQTSGPSEQDVSLSTAVLPWKDEVSPRDLPSRLRISQFLILPPYQASGHGSALYNTIYSNTLADSTIHELTVEDPSEEFDVLRDINDWKTLEPRFAAANFSIQIAPFDTPEKRRSVRLPTSRLLDLQALRSIRANTKISPRQFARLSEMYLLSRVPHSRRAAGGTNLTRLLIQKSTTSDPNDRFYYWWRLLVKQRVFKKNRDILLQLDSGERHQQVDEAFRGQEDEYEKLLMLFATSKTKEEVEVGNGHGSKSDRPSARERKRKMVIEDEEDEDEDGKAVLPSGPNAKVARAS